MIKKPIVLVLFLFLFSNAGAQNFASDIAAFKKQDAVSFPPPNAILFVGSSSFTKWVDVQNYFPAHVIINRGFGGSTLPDLIYYEKEIIFAYKPRQIVIYCGENDIASSDTISGKIVFERFKTIFMDIRNWDAHVNVVYISMKPSISRWSMKGRIMEGNKLIRKYLNKQKGAKYISVWKPMLGKDGKPLQKIFTSDNLHINAEGYAIWQKLIEPYLLE